MIGHLFPFKKLYFKRNMKTASDRLKKRCANIIFVHKQIRISGKTFLWYYNIK